MKQPISPLKIVTLFCSFQVAAFLLMQVMAQTEIYPINIFGKISGIDYYDPFFIGSKLLSTGLSPYLHTRYTSPPLFALINTPFLSFDPQTLSYVLSIISFVFVTSGTFLCFHIFFGRDIDYTDIAGKIFIITAFSFPFLFLFDRSNIDALVFGAVILGLTCLSRYELIAGFCFATGFALKIYPIILLAPLLVLKKKRAIFSFLGCAAAYIVLQQTHWINYLGTLADRTTMFTIYENASMAAAFNFFGKFINMLFDTGLPLDGIFRRHYLIIYIGLFCATLFADFRSRHESRSDHVTLLLTYFPFMVAAPKLAYNYELIFMLPLIPMLAWLARDASRPQNRNLLIAATMLLALTQFQTVGFYKLTGLTVMHAVPPFALVALIVLLLVLKTRAAREGISLRDSLSDSAGTIHAQGQ